MNNILKKDFSNGVAVIAQVLDVVGIWIISLIIQFLYLDHRSIEKEYFNALILISILSIFLFQKFGIYSSWRGRSKLNRIQKIISIWLLSVAVIVLYSATLKTTAAFSRVWFFSLCVCVPIYLNLYRYILDLILMQTRKKGWNHKSIVIFGAGELGRNVGEKIQQEDWTGFSIKAYFDDNVEKIGKELNKIVIQDSKNLEAFINSNEIRELWIALPFRDEERVKKILYDLRHLSISIKLIPDIFGFRLLNQNISEIAGIPILQINGTPIQGVNRLIKEVEDRMLSLIIVIIISPILLMISVLIKLTSRGPVFYKQLRNGWDGKVIKVYKFRSMYLHTEDQKNIIQATKNDKRITSIGSFLRRTSLDELPQFINVLQGRMSIVGPRPHPISQNEQFKDQVEYYMQRHRVKPGITGWAQINGFRGETDTLDKMTKRVEYDLYYIENWSLTLDIKIIIMTIFKGFINKNAY